MRKLCPNFDREDGLETVLKISMPDEAFSSTSGNNAFVQLQNIHEWMKTQPLSKLSGGGRKPELHLLLNVVGSPLIPLQVQSDQAITHTVKETSIIGLDPRSASNIFIDAVCIGEKTIKSEDCFILMLDAGAETLQARSSPNFEIIHHTICGYFSQKSGLMIQFEDSHLLRLSAKVEDSVFWETSMESVIKDYKYIDGINLAHSGTTMVTLLRYGAGSANHKRKMMETWRIEEIDFNIWGLSMESFLPPSDLKQADG